MSITPINSIGYSPTSIKRSEKANGFKQNSNLITFGNEGGATSTSKFMWGLFAGAVACVATAALFEKSIIKYAYKKNVWKNTIKDLAKKAKELESYSLEDVQKYIQEKHMGVKNAKESFVCKLDSKTMKSCNIKSNQALVLGYNTLDNGLKVTDVIKCKGLDQNLIDALDKTNYAHLSYKH